MATHPRGRHGTVVYDLADFGLDADERRAALRPYVERFGVREEVLGFARYFWSEGCCLARMGSSTRRGVRWPLTADTLFAAPGMTTAAAPLHALDPPAATSAADTHMNPGSDGAGFLVGHPGRRSRTRSRPGPGTAR